MNSLIPFELNHKDNKISAKNIILMSLLEYFCRSKRINDPIKIYKELEKIGVIDKSTLSAYTSDYGNKVLSVLSNLGGINDVIADFSISRFEREFIHTSFIGMGSTAEVFSATHLLDMKKYAIKKIPLNIFNTISLRETRYLANLDHKNVIKYFSSWLDVDDSEIPKLSLNHIDDQNNT